MRKLLVFCLALSCWLFAQAQGALMGVTLINSSDSPLSITSNTGTQSYLVSSVGIQNVSRRPVTSYRLGMIPVIAPGCGPRRVVGEQEIVERGPDLPFTAGEVLHAEIYGASLRRLRDFAAANHAAVSFVQLAIVGVNFADGTTWTRPMDGDLSSQDSLKEAGAAMCSKGQQRSPDAMRA